MGLAALRPWMPEERPQEPARLDPITLLPNRRQFDMDSLYWGNARATLVLITLAEAQAFNEIPSFSGALPIRVDTQETPPVVHMLSPLHILFPKGEMQANPPPQGLPWTYPTAQKASSAAAMCSSRLLKNSVFTPARGRSSGTISQADDSPLRGGYQDAWRRPPASRHVQLHFP